MLVNEQDYITKAFNNNFSRGSQPLVLYGIGKNTAIILEHSNVEIAGLMDKDTTGKVVYGKKVLSYEEVISMKPDIVIVARDSIVNIIYKRICFLEEQDIKIFKVDGTLLSGQQVVYENEKLPYWNISENDLRQQIDNHEIISFDIFDTLITRRLATPIVCTLEEEKQLVLPRKCMVDMLDYAIKCGKKVFLLSDMYFKASELRELLDICGVPENVEIIVSCEYGKTKENGALFEVLKEKCGVLYEGEARHILHIGDNRIADLEMAEKAGIDSFLIMSGYELLMASDMQEILSVTGGRRWNENMGWFISDYFNSPFTLYNKKGHVKTEDMYELGYYFIAPIVYEFVYWLIEAVKKAGVEKMLFPARDGWLFYQVYERFREKNPKLPEGIYFKASRRAVTVAAIRNIDDIRENCKRRFNGSVSEFAEQRFGIEISENTEWKNEEKQTEEFILKYKDIILKNAECERTSYIKYLEDRGIMGNTSKGIFDFVAGGTVQHYCERIIPGQLTGYYFATMNLPNDFFKVGDINVPFGNITSYGNNSALSKYYLWLEAIFTDADSTFVKVSADGKCIFADAKNAAYSYMKQVHDGVLEYVSKRLAQVTCMEEVDFKVSEQLLEKCFKEDGIITDEIRKLFKNDDLYDGVKTYEVK